MKTQTNRKSSNQGSALVLTLVLGTIMLLTVASYLQLLGAQKTMVVRSESWNASLIMAEGGVEESMAQINAFPDNPLTTQDFSGNSWGSSNNFFGPMTHKLQGGKYTASIANTVPPVIYASGFATVPVSGDSISRRVKVSTKKQVFSNIPLGARQKITLNGSGLAVDSWNSRDPNLSTDGLFDPNKTSTNGDVASIGGVVDIGNHTIDGSLYLGPTASLVANANGTVTGTIYTDSNINYPDITLPNVTWQSAPTVGGVHTFTTSGSYQVSDSAPIVVQPGVFVNLNVTTSVIYAPTSIQINGGTTNSGTAYIYLNGPPSLTLTGNSAPGASNRPENLRYFGLPSLTSVSFSGDTSFVGCIYAPEADITLGGGGNKNANPNFLGSIVGNTITMNGKYNIHFDTSLDTNGPGYYVADSWQEL